MEKSQKTKEIVEFIHGAAYNDSEKMPYEEWQEERRGGLGGSDVAAIIGDSPFNTNLTLFLDKTDIVKQDLSNNWFRLEYGHALEDLVAQCFAHKMGAEIINETGMFKHPDYDFVRANLDRLAILPTGELVLLECKTTNPFARSAWELAPPIYYVWQGRQYLAVINAILAKAGFPKIQKIYYSCVYGNTEDDVIIRKVELDERIEVEMIAAECEFWNEHVVKRIMPEFNGTNVQLLDLSLAHRVDLARLKGVTEIKDNLIIENPMALQYVSVIEQLKAEEKVLNDKVKALKEQRAAAEVSMIDLMMGATTAALADGRTVSIGSRTSKSTNYERMLEVYPDAFANCVTVGEAKPSISIKAPKTVRKSKPKAAATSVA